MRIFLLFAMMCFTMFAEGQCNCQSIKRDDGTNIIQCDAVQILSDQTMQIGINVSSNEEQYFVSLIIRFKANSKDFKGDLSILLTDKTLLRLPYVNSSRNRMGESNVSIGIFEISSANQEKLLNTSISTINFQFSDGVMQTFQNLENKNCLSLQLKCVMKNLDISVQKSPTTKQESTAEILQNDQNDSSPSLYPELDLKNGFRNLKLGMNRNDIHDFNLVFKNHYNGCDNYKITFPKISIAQVQINLMELAFINDKLAQIMIALNWDENTPSDRNNGTSGEKCEEVERLLVELFGEGEVENNHYPQSVFMGLKEYKYPGTSVYQRTWKGKNITAEYIRTSSQLSWVKFYVIYRINDFEQIRKTGISTNRDLSKKYKSDL